MSSGHTQRCLSVEVFTPMQNCEWVVLIELRETTWGRGAGGLEERGVECSHPGDSMCGGG